MHQEKETIKSNDKRVKTAIVPKKVERNSRVHKRVIKGDNNTSLTIVQADDNRSYRRKNKSSNKSMKSTTKPSTDNTANIKSIVKKRKQK